MDFTAITKKSVKELHDLLAQKRDELRELRHKDSERQLKNVRAIRAMRKTIAQILTVLNNRQSEATDQQ